MKPTLIGFLFFKFLRIIEKFRIILFRLRGLQIGKGTSLGNISCEWPHLLKIGINCELQDNISFKTWHPYSKENFIKLGDRVFIGQGCAFASASKIIIGDDCLIASGTTIIDGGHEFDRSQKINKQAVIIEEIIIGNDVWIGMSCSILKGVTIGTGAVIAAGSVVNKSIPEYEVWGGVPARFIKKRN